MYPLLREFISPSADTDIRCERTSIAQALSFRWSFVFTYPYYTDADMALPSDRLPFCQGHRVAVEGSVFGVVPSIVVSSMSSLTEWLGWSSTLGAFLRKFLWYQVPISDIRCMRNSIVFPLSFRWSVLFVSLSAHQSSRFATYSLLSSVHSHTSWRVSMKSTTSQYRFAPRTITS